MNNDNYMGLGGFYWFTGVVEDRNDPLKVGRVKVRIIGAHTSDKTILPTEDLPWALVMLPITASGVSGIGQSATGLLEGSWVFGFFRDNPRNQEPVILGSLPGRPTDYGLPIKGFSDPNIRPNKTIKDGEIIDKENENDPDVSVYPRYINEPDVNRLAVNNPDKPHPSLAIDAANRVTGIQAYNSEWSQPASTYGAIYPYNQVYESESGHIVEFDDTTDHERIHIRHKSGTRLEITANGDQLAIIKGNNYLIIDKDNKVYIKGNSDITVNGNASIKAGQEANVLANTINAVANTNINMSASNVNITGNVLINGTLDVMQNVSLEADLLVQGDTSLEGNNTINGYDKP